MSVNKTSKHIARNACVVMAALAAFTIFSHVYREHPSAPNITPPSVPLVETSLAAGEISVHFVDVGQADAILIKSDQNAVLIDGGDYKTRNTLVDYLRRVGVTALDYVVATHPHADHIGGLPEVMRQFAVKEVIMPDIVHTTVTFAALLTVMEAKNLPLTVPTVGDTLTAGILKFIVLAPVKSYPKNDLNNASVVLRMIHGETAFLFTGDAEERSERDMLANRLDLRADVLKAGHHGSGTSTTPEFLTAVNPGIVVVMCGIGNTYGHPSASFLNLVRQPERNITLLRTDESGTVVLITDGREIKTRIEKRG